MSSFPNYSNFPPGVTGNEPYFTDESEPEMVEKWIDCPKCTDGTQVVLVGGAYGDPQNDTEQEVTCSECRGTGEVVIVVCEGCEKPEGEDCQCGG